jgi:hypothetical protein
LAQQLALVNYQAVTITSVVVAVLETMQQTYPLVVLAAAVQDLTAQEFPEQYQQAAAVVQVTPQAVAVLAAQV